MEYQITTTESQNKRETTLHCEFHDEHIVNLLDWEKAGLDWNGRIYEYVYQSACYGITAKKDGKKVILALYQSNASEVLKEVAANLALQEHKLLPVVKYWDLREKSFEKKVNEAFQKWFERELKRCLDPLRERVHSAVRAINGYIFQHIELADKVDEMERDYNSIFRDFGFCLDFDNTRLLELREALAELEKAFSLHREKKLHLLDRGQ